MQLDLIIPTYNRCRSLCRTFESLLNAPIPSGITVRVVVVDNNSTDSTRDAVQSYQGHFGGRLDYAFEKRQGRSFALNAGITSTGGELIGMIDDDEEIDSNWYSVVYSSFQDGRVDFIGGPYVPRWETSPPDWLPRGHLGAIGWVDGGNTPVPFDKNYPGILMGGNAVLTRAILNKVGLYNTQLGRTGQRLLAGEDDDMYQRLLAAGARGVYVPELVIHHHIPPERLTRRYFRSWCFWRGVSSGLIDRDRQMPVVYFAGMPRYLYGQAARGLAKVIAAAFNRRRDESQVFNSELAIWDTAGFFYGKHFYATSRSRKPNS